MDPLSDVIALLRPTAAISKPITGRGKWGVSYAAYDLPGFTIVLEGECWLRLQDDAPIRLCKGDYILLPSTPAFTLSSNLDAHCEPREPAASIVRHGEQDGPPDFVSIGGSFRINQVNVALLKALLPRIIFIPATRGRTTKLNRVIDLIVDECTNDSPGKDMLLERLLEILLIETLRCEGIATEEEEAGLLKGMRDPMLSPVLHTMHANVRARWTVADFARIAGMSRSAFSAKFGEVLGCGPIEYLGRWRMALAKDALVQGTKPLERIADEIGYESASAFSTAFRKRLGCSPGRFARAIGLPHAM